MLNVESQGPVLKVTLNRPEVRNAFNSELISSLTHAFRSMDESVRAVVLRGEGKAFCAGGDLNWMREAATYTKEQNRDDALRLAELFEAMIACPAVIVAQIQGAAFGGGTGLVACADVAVATHGTKFSFSEVRLGLVPATISPHVITKIGSGHARALFTTGEVFEAEKALRIGLIHDSCEESALSDLVKAKVNDVLRNGPRSVARSKQLALEDRLEKQAAAQLLAEVRAGDEAKAGIAAFLDKQAAPYVTLWEDQ
jgi:enoyl-CoA hydratase/carnithine racemase